MRSLLEWSCTIRYLRPPAAWAEPVSRGRKLPSRLSTATRLRSPNFVERNSIRAEHGSSQPTTFPTTMGLACRGSDRSRQNLTPRGPPWVDSLFLQDLRALDIPATVALGVVRFFRSRREYAPRSREQRHNCHDASAADRHGGRGRPDGKPVRRGQSDARQAERSTVPSSGSLGLPTTMPYGAVLV